MSEKNQKRPTQTNVENIGAETNTTNGSLPVSDTTPKSKKKKCAGKELLTNALSAICICLDTSSRNYLGHLYHIQGRTGQAGYRGIPW